MGNALAKKTNKIKEKFEQFTNKKRCRGCPSKQYNWDNETDILGTGEASTVFRCSNDEGRKFAIKRTSPFALTTPTLTRLIQEAALLNEISTQIEKFSHRFLQLEEGYIDKEGGFCLVTELVEGFELLALAELFPVGVPEYIVKTIMKQTLEAIEELHNKDIAHCDLKLENIMLDTTTNEIKIIDFGFACRTSVYNRERKMKQQTRLTAFRGSPHYVAPQLVLSRPFDGKKADIWSLGVLCCTLLMSKFPFNGASHNDVFTSILYDTPQLSSHISDDAKSFAMAMLSRNESLRPDAGSLLSHPFLQDCKPLQSIPKPVIFSK